LASFICCLSKALSSCTHSAKVQVAACSSSCDLVFSGDKISPVLTFFKVVQLAIIFVHYVIKISISFFIKISNYSFVILNGDIATTSTLNVSVLVTSALSVSFAFKASVVVNVTKSFAQSK